MAPLALIEPTSLWMAGDLVDLSEFLVGEAGCLNGKARVFLSGDGANRPGGNQAAVRISPMALSTIRSGS